MLSPVSSIFVFVLTQFAFILTIFFHEFYYFTAAGYALDFTNHPSHLTVEYCELLPTRFKLQASVLSPNNLLPCACSFQPCMQRKVFCIY